MEKSMVQELNSLTYSNIFNNRVSFISTHISDPDVNELRRSRIQNLPGHRKEDLSSKINFVVVFQTIEIERLSREIESLRVKARDWQRQRINYQNYEVQIRELTERCHMLQLQKEGMEEEADKMKIFCEKLYRQFQEYKAKFGEADAGLKEKYNLERKRSEQLQSQIDKWRNRFTSLQKSKSKELEEMRTQMEAQRKSYINREIKQLTIKYENQIQTLVGELRKARQETDWRISEMQRLQHIVDGFDMRQNEIKEIEDKMYEYENRFVMLSQENYRLNELLRWKVEELEKLKATEKELRVKFESSKQMEDTNKSLSLQISRLTQEIQERKIAISRTSQKLQKLQLDNQKLVQYQKLVDQSATEIERLNTIIHSKINETDQYKNSVRVLESKLSAVNNATQKQFAAYEERMVTETKEKERLHAQLKNRLAENQNLKARVTELQRWLSKIEGLERENNDLKGQINVSNRRMDQLRAKISILEENVAIIEGLQKTLKNDEKIKQQLIGERERLNATIRSLTLQLETSNEKLSAIQAEQNKFTNIQTELKEYQSKLAYMTQQLDRINAEIQLRVGELHQLRESLKGLTNAKNIYQSIEQKLVENMAQMEKLILELDQSRRENQRLQNTNMTLESSVRTLQRDIIGANQQRQQLSAILGQKSAEISQLSQKVESMATKVSQHRILQQQNEQYQKKVESMKSSYHQLEARFKSQAKKSDQYSKEVERLCNEVIQLRQQPKFSAKLTEELAIVRSQCDQKNKIIISLNKRIQVIQTILRSIKQRYAAQYQLGEEMRRRVQSASAKLVIVEEVLDMANRYSEELTRVNETNMMLESHNRLLDVQMCQSMKVLDSERAEERAPHTLLGTFGHPSPAAYRNESIAAQVPASFEARDGNTFTFKEVQSTRVINSSHPYQHLQGQGREDRVYQRKREEGEISSLHEARDTTSVASSFINSLVGREETNRFDNVQRIQYQGIQQSNFGRHAPVRVQYVEDTSPRSRPATSSYYSPSHRATEVRYVTIDSQIDPTQQGQIYTNPFQEPPHPFGQSAILQNAGIKRVTSYTHFTGYPVSNIQGSRANMGPIYVSGQPGQQLQMYIREVPNIRVLEAAQSQNIGASPKSSSNHYGKPVRIGGDNARLQPNYRPQ